MKKSLSRKEKSLKSRNVLASEIRNFQIRVHDGGIEVFVPSHGNFKEETELIKELEKKLKKLGIDASGEILFSCF